MWKRHDVDFIESKDIPWTLVPQGELGGGDRQRILSEALDSPAKSVVLQLHNEYHGVLTDGADIFVLEGYGTVNGQEFGPHHYLYVPAGAKLDIVPGPSRVTLFVGYFGAATLDRDAEPGNEGIQHLDVASLPWAPPEWNGDVELEPGVFVKWLRRGPVGEVFVTAMLPGWTSPVEERHPIYEESFRLYGDLLQGRRGRMGPGGYSYRSPMVWHCPMGTHGGTFTLIRSSAPITSEYRESTVGSYADLLRDAYRNVPSPAVH